MKERSLNFLKLVDRYVGIPALYILAAVRGGLSLLLPPRACSVRTVVMVKLWGVGNLVMIIPLIRAVRGRFPEARIHFVTLEGNAELLQALPELDGITTLKTGSIFAALCGVLQLPFRLQRLKPDLFLDFEQFLRITPLLAILSGATQRVGLRTPGQARALLYNIKVPYRIDRHMTRTFGDVVRCAGIDTARLASLEVPRSAVAAGRVEKLLEEIADGERIVAIHPGSGDNFPARRWPIEKFAAVAEKVHRATGARIVLTGTAPEAGLATRFTRCSPVPFANLMGELNLLEFVEFLARVDILITNDTAPVHIASALNKPIVALYGPNTPDLYGPMNDLARAFYLRFPCSPCITNLNAKTSSCQVPSCILNIESDRVAETVLRLLDRNRSEHPADKVVPR